MMELAVAERLPAPRGEIKDDVWHAIRELARDGRPFRATDLHAALPARKHVATSIKSLLSYFYRSGHLAKTPVETKHRKSKESWAFTLTQDPSPPPTDIAFYVVRDLRLEIPRTQAGLWAMMRWLDEHRNGFTERELSWIVKHDIDAAAVAAYVKALERGGFIFAADDIVDIVVYRVNRRQITTPRVRADGTVLVSAQRVENMWRSMKMCGYFTALDLASASSMPDLPVSEDTAARYADELTAAGYVIARVRDGEPTVYRLKPKMITGPAAPEVMRARFVWDPNLCRVMGQATCVEEVRP